MHFVDYSCALQKEILVHGRLYVTQNYLCFYANIFRWETTVTLQWKDVTAITKEKTALVIPNAILLSTESDKYFLTSFSARDKTYLMLFRVWQNALMDQPMTAQEMWQWVRAVKACRGSLAPLYGTVLNWPQQVFVFQLPNSTNNNKQQPI